MQNNDTTPIPTELYNKLVYLGIIDPSGVRNSNEGNSDYAQHLLQPWSIWLCHDLNPWDADIIKRVLRHKKGESRITDYMKISHICQERIRQISFLEAAGLNNVFVTKIPE